LWQYAWRGFLTNPLLGKGYGWLLPIRAGGLMEIDYPASNVHNSYIHVLACSGLLGFIPLIVVVVRFFALISKAFLTNTSPFKRVWIAAACSVGLNAFWTPITNVTLENLSGILVWVLIALAVRITLASEKELLAIVPYRLVWNASPREAAALESRLR
jgi:O-antigen ligase